MHRFTVLGILLAVAISSSACGTSASSSQDGVEAPGRAAFIERADRVCRGMDRAQTAAINAYVAKQGGGRLTRAESERMIVEVALPPVRAEVEQLEALPMPAGDEEEIRAFLDEVLSAIEVGEDDPGTLAGSASLGPFRAANKLARAYGFRDCAFPL